MLSQLLGVVAPVFAVAAVGWVAGKVRRLELSTLTDVVLYLAAPALVFHSLAARPLELEGLAAVGGGAAFQVLACGAVTWLVLAALKRPGRGLALATMFPNTGNLGLPLALLAFGAEGLSVAVIVFTAITVLHYSIGVAIVSGRAGVGAALRMPLLHAALLGIVCGLAGWAPPGPMMRSLELLGEAAVPLMLLSLGLRMRTVRLSRPALALLAVALRMGPGLAAALTWCWWLGLAGPERGVIVVTGVLPSAVMNFVLAEAADQQSEEVASAILLGTVLSVLAIPLVLTLLV